VPPQTAGQLRQLWTITTKTIKTEKGDTTTTVTKTVAPMSVVPTLVPIYFMTDSDKSEPTSGPVAGRDRGGDQGQFAGSGRRDQRAREGGSLRGT
jgi:hypothetical protein